MAIFIVTEVLASWEFRASKLASRRAIRWVSYFSRLRSMSTFLALMKPSVADGVAGVGEEMAGVG